MAKSNQATPSNIVTRGGTIPGAVAIGFHRKRPVAVGITLRALWQAVRYRER